MLKESATTPLAPFAGLWAYPWDIAQWGIKRTVEKVRSAGITDLSVATVYHSGQILSLATGEPRFFTRNDGPLFSFRQDVWQDGGLEIRPQQFYRELSGQLRAEGIRLRGWVIAGHDQTHLKPVINAFGQEIRHAACPVANQEQFVQMIRDLAAWNVFSGLDLESVGYTAAVHGAHHDISGIVITPLLRILLSVCFCPSCAAVFGGATAWEAFHQEVRDSVVQLVAQEPAPLEPMAEVATYLVEHPQFVQFLSQRSRTIEDIIRRAAASSGNMALATMLVPYGGQAQLSWMEGVLADPSVAWDVIALGYASPQALQHDVNWLYRKGWDPSRIIVGQTLTATMTADFDQAQMRLRAALNLGIQRFTFYNMGLLNAQRWNWMTALVQQIRASI